MKTILIYATVALALGTALYQGKRASQLQRENSTLLFQQRSSSERIEQLENGRDASSKNLTVQQAVPGPAGADQSELLKLRAEVTTLRSQLRESGRRDAPSEGKNHDPAESEMRSWVDRVTKLKEQLAQSPEQRIPEFRFLSEQDWLDAVRDVKQFDTENGGRQALSSLRNSARSEFAGVLQNALRAYAQAGHAQPPAELSQLQPYFPPTVDEAVLQRYELAQPGIVTSRLSPQDEPEDKSFQISMNTLSSASGDEKALEPTLEAFSEAHPGEIPADPAQLVPYAKSPGEQTALQRLIQKGAAK